MTSDAKSSARPARRQALGALSMLGALTLQACGGGGGTSGTASGNAVLLGLSLSTGSLSPAFASDTLSYTVAVSNTTASLDFAQELLGIKSPSEAVELWTSHAKKQFEAITAQAKELAELGQKVAAETVEPIKANASKLFKPAA